MAHIAGDRGFYAFRRGVIIIIFFSFPPKSVRFPRYSRYIIIIIIMTLNRNNRMEKRSECVRASVYIYIYIYSRRQLSESNYYYYATFRRRDAARSLRVSVARRPEYFGLPYPVVIITPMNNNDGGKLNGREQKKKKKKLHVI